MFVCQKPKLSSRNEETISCQRQVFGKESCANSLKGDLEIHKWEFYDSSCDNGCVNLCWTDISVTYSTLSDSDTSIPEQGVCESKDLPSDEITYFPTTQDDSHSTASTETIVNSTTGLTIVNPTNRPTIQNSTKVLQPLSETDLYTTEKTFLSTAKLISTGDSETKVNEIGEDNVSIFVWIALGCGLILVIIIIVIALVLRRNRTLRNKPKNESIGFSDIRPYACSGEVNHGYLFGTDEAPSYCGGEATASSPSDSGYSASIALGNVYNDIEDGKDSSQPTPGRELNVSGKDDGGHAASVQLGSVYCMIADSEVTSAKYSTGSSVTKIRNDDPKARSNIVIQDQQLGLAARVKTWKGETKTKGDNNYSKLNNGQMKSAADVPSNILRTYNENSETPVKFMVASEKKVKGSSHVYSSLSNRDEMPLTIQESVLNTYNRAADEFSMASIHQGAMENSGNEARVLKVSDSSSNGTVVQGKEVRVNDNEIDASDKCNDLYASATEGSVYCTIADGEIMAAKYLTGNSSTNRDGVCPKEGTDAVSLDLQLNDRAKTSTREINTTEDNNYSKLNDGKMRSAADVPRNILHTYNAASATPINFVAGREKTVKRSDHIYSSLSNTHAMPAYVQGLVLETYNASAGEFNPATFNKDTKDNPGELQQLESLYSLPRGTVKQCKEVKVSEDESQDRRKSVKEGDIKSTSSAGSSDQHNIEYFVLEDDGQGHIGSATLVPSGSSMEVPSEQENTEYFELEDCVQAKNGDNDLNSSVLSTAIKPVNMEYFELEDCVQPDNGDSIMKSSVLPPAIKPVDVEYFELEDCVEPDNGDSNMKSSILPPAIKLQDTEYFALEDDAQQVNSGHRNHEGFSDANAGYVQSSEKPNFDNFHIYQEIPNDWEKTEYAELDEIQR